MDVNVSVPLLLALLAAVAAFIRQLWVVVLPLVAVPLFYVGLKSGWWGGGVGDGWQYAAALVTVVGLLGSILGVAVGRFLTRIVRHGKRTSSGAGRLREGGGGLVPFRSRRRGRRTLTR